MRRRYCCWSRWGSGHLVPPDICAEQRNLASSRRAVSKFPSKSLAFANVRYRGLTNNTHRLPVTCALANFVHGAPVSFALPCSVIFAPPPRPRRPGFPRTRLCLRAACARTRVSLAPPSHARVARILGIAPSRKPAPVRRLRAASHTRRGPRQLRELGLDQPDLYKCGGAIALGRDGDQVI